MSMAPNNPFDSNQNPNQYGYQPQPSQGSNVWLWVLGTIGGLFLLGSLVCCGGIYFAYTKVKTEIDQEVGTSVVERFGEDPNFKENIGEVKSVETDFGAVFSEIQKAEKDKSKDVPMMIMQVEGEKGRGRLIFQTNQDTGEEKVVLIMEDGQEFELEDSEDFYDSFDEMTAELEDQAAEDAETETESSDSAAEGDSEKSGVETGSETGAAGESVSDNSKATAE